MAKQITITYNGKEYTLEFTRRSIETMERQGFVASDISKRPMSVLPNLFAGAFIANHKQVRTSLIDEIFQSLKNKDQLIEKLGEMYNEPLEALLDDPDEDEGNAQWGANW